MQLLKINVIFIETKYARTSYQDLLCRFVKIDVNWAKVFSLLT